MDPQHTSPYMVPQDGRRCRSAPPYSIRDITYYAAFPNAPPGMHLPLWQVDFPLDEYQDIQDIHVKEGVQDPSFSHVLILDKKHVLKMMSPLVDVTSLVAIMRVAAAVVPVPKVIKSGYSGNCSYILYEYMPGHTMIEIGNEYGIYALAVVEPQLNEIVRRLASVGVMHNDLSPDCVVIDDRWNITGIIGWFFCSPIEGSQPYETSITRSAHVWQHLPRKMLAVPSHLLQHILLRHSPDRGHAYLSLNPSNGTDNIERRLAQGLLVSRQNSVRTRPRSGQMVEALPVRTTESTLKVAIIIHGVEHVLQSLVSCCIPVEFAQGPWKSASICAVYSQDQLSSDLATSLKSGGTLVREECDLRDQFTRSLHLRELVSKLPDIVLVAGYFPQYVLDDIRTATTLPLKIKGPRWIYLLRLQSVLYTVCDEEESCSMKGSSILEIRVAVKKMLSGSELDIFRRIVRPDEAATVGQAKHQLELVERSTVRAVIGHNLHKIIGLESRPT